MKNLITAVAIILTPLCTLAQSPQLTSTIKGISKGYFDHLTSDDLKKCGCNNITPYFYIKPKQKELAILQLQTNSDAYYFHNFKVRTYGKHISYNKSIRKNNEGKEVEGMLLLNRDVLIQNNWRMNPYSKMVILTTAEEINESYFKSGTWKLNTPKNIDGKEYRYANFMNDGTHPAIRTEYPNYDAEFRYVLLVDKDDNLNILSDNELLITCVRIIIDF